MQTLESRLAALRNKAAAPTAQNWKPVAGETIAGEIVGHGSFTHSTYGTQTTLLLMDENGLLTSVLLNAYLRQGLGSQCAVEGDLVAITFHGKVAGKNGVQFNQYSLMVEK